MAFNTSKRLRLEQLQLEVSAALTKRRNDLWLELFFYGSVIPDIFLH